MRYDELEQHLRALGISDGAAVDDAVWEKLAPDRGAHVPAVLRWLFSRFAGSSFRGGAYYRHPAAHGASAPVRARDGRSPTRSLRESARRDPRTGSDVLVGWLLAPDELAQTYEDTRGALPDDVLPIENDGGDNHIAVGTGRDNAGRVFCHVHDAPLDSSLVLVHDSLIDFLWSLHSE